MGSLQGLCDHVDISEILTQLVADGAENLAQDWAATLGRDYQVGLPLLAVVQLLWWTYTRPGRQCAAPPPV